jgi:hypothetical protein
MNWKDIAGVVGKAAPILGTLLGGPAGGAIGGLVAAALGVANTPDAVHAAIAADPGQALKLAEYEDDNRVKLQAMLFAHADNEIAADTARIQADVADRASARAREVSVRGVTPAALAWLVVTASVALGAAVVTGAVTQNPAQAALVGTVIGYVFSEAKQVLAYYFGSSSGSDRKTELLAMAPAPPPSAHNPCNRSHIQA